MRVQLLVLLSVWVCGAVAFDEDYGGEDYGGQDYGGEDYGGEDYGQDQLSPPEEAEVEGTELETGGGPPLDAEVPSASDVEAAQDAAGANIDTDLAAAEAAAEEAEAAAAAAAAETAAAEAAEAAEPTADSIDPHTESETVDDGHESAYNNDRKEGQRDLSKYREEEGRTILMHAVIEGAEEEAVKILDGKLEGKHDLGKTDTNGHTLLHHAAVSGSAELVRKLVDSGADIKAKDSEGQTPHDRAKTFGRPKPVLRLLLGQKDEL